MSISIIVPVYNNPQDLRECLSALLASAGAEAEIIIVDDASTDETPAVATRMGARVFQLPKNSGPAAARNFGARQAVGDILFFVDADVVVAPEAIRQVVRTFAEHPDLAAMFGSYDTTPRAHGVVSQYRNLLHHFVHQHGNPEASTFWAGCGAMRRAVFEDMGGFDERRFPRPSIEDIELGYRLRHAGHRILLDKSLQGKHLKRWTLCSMIRTDIVCRAIPWARLMLESKQAPDDLNLKGGQRLSVALVGVASVLVLLSTFWIELLAFSMTCLLGVIVLNRKLYGFFLHQRGPLFAGASTLLHLLYYFYSGISYLSVQISFQVGSAAKRWRHPVHGEEHPSLESRKP